MRAPRGEGGGEEKEEGRNSNCFLSCPSSGMEKWRGGEERRRKKERERANVIAAFPADSTCLRLRDVERDREERKEKKGEEGEHWTSALL